MRTNMFREGIKVMAKLGRGIYCIVTRVDDISGSPVAYAKEIDAADEVVEDGREFVIDKDNCLAFRFIKDPNPDDKPQLMVEDGRLVYEDGHAIEMGSIHAHDMIGTVRGAVIFSADREDGSIDIYSYMPRRDRFTRLVHGIQPLPVVVKEDDDNIYITEFRSHTEEADNPDDKDMLKEKEVVDQAFFARLSAKAAKKIDLPFRFDEAGVRPVGRDEFIFEHMEDDNDIIFYYILDPSFQGMNVAFSKKRADTVTQVCIADKGYLFKNDEEIMYVNEFGDSVKTRVEGIDLSDVNNLIDITHKESATVYSLADDDLKKVKRVVAKYTPDRGEIVYLEAA